MFYTDVRQLLDGAAEVASDPLPRFLGNADIMYNVMRPYLTAFGASEREIDHLIGHDGLKGKAGNFGYMVNAVFDQENRDSALQRAFLLSTAEYLANPRPHCGQHTHENMIAACNRVIDDIGHWAEEHADEIDPVDRGTILHARQEFADALNDIYDFMMGCQSFFRTHPIDLRVPAPYVRFVQQQADAAGISIPICALQP